MPIKARSWVLRIPHAHLTSISIIGNMEVSLPRFPSALLEIKEVVQTDEQTTDRSNTWIP